MGGFGSGDRNATGAATCESCLSIDLAWLQRRGMLQLGRHSPLTWSLAGEQTGSIMLIAQPVSQVANCVSSVNLAKNSPPPTDAKLE